MTLICFVALCAAACSNNTSSANQQDTSGESVQSLDTQNQQNSNSGIDVESQTSQGFNTVSATGSTERTTETSLSEASTTVTTTAQQTSVSTTAVETTQNSNSQSVIELTNAHRVDIGCPVLTANQQLAAAAQSHADDMLNNNFFDHQSSNGDQMADRVQAAGYSYRLLAENIAAGQRSESQVVDDWLNSPGHRRNIENCNLSEMGLGRAGNYWVQVLGTSQ